MISSFHAIIPSFHGMISSFHAVFGLRQRDKSAKIIDYNDQVIRVREYLLFRGIPSPMYFQLSRRGKWRRIVFFLHVLARTVARTCGEGCKYVRLRWVKLAQKSSALFWIREREESLTIQITIVPRKCLLNPFFHRPYLSKVSQYFMPCLFHLVSFSRILCPWNKIEQKKIGEYIRNTYFCDMKQ